MNRKGFTLIELLAIIALISIITLIAIPSIRYASKKITQKNYETKLQVIKAAAQDYGEDIKETIMYGDSYIMYNGYHAIEVTVQTLLNNGYLVKDNNLSDEVTADIKDPRDDSSLLNKTIIIYIKNKTAYAKLWTEE